MKTKSFLIALNFLICTIVPLNAQVLHSGILSAGGNATGIGGSASYSVGQLVYTTVTGTTGSLAQGVQQPYEINVVSGIDDIYGIELFSAYPNPASTHLILKIENNELTSFSYQMINIVGAVIKTGKITDHETTINMASLLSAAYYLRIIADKKEVKVFKIIKN